MNKKIKLNEKLRMKKEPELNDEPKCNEICFTSYSFVDSLSTAYRQRPGSNPERQQNCFSTDYAFRNELMKNRGKLF